MAALAALLLALAACEAGDPIPSGPVHPAERIEGWVTTRGGELLDARGKTVRLLGLGIRGMGVGSGAPAGEADPGWEVPSEETYDNVARWGFNSVRLTLAWANLEPRPPSQRPDGTFVHHYDEAYLRAVDEIVEGFGRRGIAVVLCMSQHKWSPAFRVSGPRGGAGKPGSGMPAWLYPSSQFRSHFQGKRAFFDDRGHSWEWFADAWREVAARYADDPTVVGADVLNEPYWGTRWLPSPRLLRLDELYRYVGGEIRKVNPRILLIFEDSQDRPGAGLAMTRRPPFDGVVYSFHLYTQNWTPEGLTRTERFRARAERWGVPLWIGEFNRFGPSEIGGAEPLPEWREHLADMLEHTRRHGISWSYWAYRGVDGIATKRDEVGNEDLLRLLQSGF